MKTKLLLTLSLTISLCLTLMAQTNPEIEIQPEGIEFTSQQGQSFRIERDSNSLRIGNDSMPDMLRLKYMGSDSALIQFLGSLDLQGDLVSTDSNLMVVLADDVAGIIPFDSTKTGIVPLGGQAMAFVTGQDSSNFLVDEIGAVGTSVTFIPQKATINSSNSGRSDDNHIIAPNPDEEGRLDFLLGHETRRLMASIDSNGIYTAGDVLFRDSMHLHYADSEGLSVMNGDSALLRFNTATNVVEVLAEIHTGNSVKTGGVFIEGTGNDPTLDFKDTLGNVLATISDAGIHSGNDLTVANVLHAQGKVGIGTGIPVTELDVNGATTFRGNVDIIGDYSFLNQGDPDNGSIRFAANGGDITLDGGTGDNIRFSSSVYFHQSGDGIRGPSGTRSMYWSSTPVYGVDDAVRMQRPFAFDLQAANQLPYHLASHDNIVLKLDGINDPADNRYFAITHGTSPVTELLRVQEDGKVGIGTDSPDEELHVVGDICHTGSIGACSDRRYKHQFQPIEGALSKVTQLNGLYYEWRRDDFPKMKFAEGQQLGVIAQEVEAHFPEIVMTSPEGYKSVDYARLTPVLLEAVKELAAQSEQQQSELEDLRQQNEALQSQLDEVAELRSMVLEMRAAMDGRNEGED